MSENTSGNVRLVCEWCRRLYIPLFFIIFFCFWSSVGKHNLTFSLYDPFRRLPSCHLSTPLHFFLFPSSHLFDRRAGENTESLLSVYSSSLSHLYFHTHAGAPSSRHTACSWQGYIRSSGVEKPHLLKHFRLFKTRAFLNDCWRSVRRAVYTLKRNK